MEEIWTREATLVGRKKTVGKGHNSFSLTQVDFFIVYSQQELE
jgi:hypothetical protein